MTAPKKNPIDRITRARMGGLATAAKGKEYMAGLGEKGHAAAIAADHRWAGREGLWIGLPLIETVQPFRRQNVEECAA